MGVTLSEENHEKLHRVIEGFNAVLADVLADDDPMLVFGLAWNGVGETEGEDHCVLVTNLPDHMTPEACMDMHRIAEERLQEQYEALPEEVKVAVREFAAEHGEEPRDIVVDFVDLSDLSILPSTSSTEG